VATPASTPIEIPSAITASYFNCLSSFMCSGKVANVHDRLPHRSRELWTCNSARDWTCGTAQALQVREAAPRRRRWARKRSELRAPGVTGFQVNSRSDGAAICATPNRR